jgi:hypothetical protein
MATDSEGKVHFVAPISFFVIVQLAASAYLLAADPYLYKYAVIHWYGLLVFAIVELLLLVVLLIRKMAPAAMAMGVWSVIGIIAILGDAASGLALSQFHSTAAEGFDYLFGFGKLDSSILATSVAVTLLLLFQILTAAVSFAAMKKMKA